MGPLLGVIFAMIIGMLAIPTYSNIMKTSADNLRTANTAQQQSEFNEALTTYVKQNSVAIQAVATATVPATITVDMLKATNLLDNSFNAVNPYGQTWQAQVLEPSTGNLQVFSYSTGGDALKDTLAIKIANMVKPAGGFIPQNDTGLYAGGSANAYGAYGKWTIDTSNFTSISGGHPASLLTFNDGQLTSNYLYRNAVPGQPQLNQMNTPIIMASVQVVNTACSDVGAIARDSLSNVISCKSGKWQQQDNAYWKDPVDTYAALLTNTCDVLSAYQTRVVKTPTTGSGARAYTCNGAGTWQPLAVDNSGNIVIDGIATISKLAGDLEITRIETVNTSCLKIGSFARDVNGKILTCQNYQWKAGDKGDKGDTGATGATGATGSSASVSSYWQSCTMANDSNYWRYTGYTCRYTGNSNDVRNFMQYMCCPN